MTNDNLDNPKDIKRKWAWKMKWCRANGYPPANSYFWNLAEEAYNEYQKKVECADGRDD